jgi:hypothetical protein
MLRYRIVRNSEGRCIVLATSIWWVPIGETYATRAEAQDTADWLNSLSDEQRQEVPRRLSASV